MPVRFFLSCVLLFFARQAVADLYRWVDPETGAIKYSSYPPPWHGDPELERRAPKVEHIPDQRTQPRGEPAAKPVAGASAPTDQRRRELLKRLLEQLANPTATGPEEAMRALLAIAEPMREYRLIESGLARSDPQGEPARRKEWEGFVASLEARRKAMTAELVAAVPPPPNTPPAELERALRLLQAKLVSYGGIAGALRSMDPPGDAARVAELQALEQKLTATWKTRFDLLKQQGSLR